MVLIFEVSLASIALLLSVVSFRTMQTIKHLAVGKTFWVPMLSSGILFFASSIAAVLADFNLAFWPYPTEVISAFRLFALCSLTAGVYAYSRKITSTLGEKFTLPAISADGVSEEIESPSILESLSNKLVKKETKELKCKHHLGYLQTLSRHSPIPEECLACHQIIDCKFSTAKTKETNHEVFQINPPDEQHEIREKHDSAKKTK